MAGIKIRKIKDRKNFVFHYFFMTFDYEMFCLDRNNQLARLLKCSSLVYRMYLLSIILSLVHLILFGETF